MPDIQSGSLCTGSDISHFEIAESHKEGTSSVNASDEACEDENSKIVGTNGSTNDPATWSGVMCRNVRGSLARIGPPTITTEVLPRNESDQTRFSKLHRSV